MDKKSTQTEGGGYTAQFALCMKHRFAVENCMENYTHSYLKELKLQGSYSLVTFAVVFLTCKLCWGVNWGFKSSLDSLIEVTSFIGAQRVEGSHDKLPIEGAACQQPLSLFAVAGVGILHKHLWTEGKWRFSGCFCLYFTAMLNTCFQLI